MNGKDPIQEVEGIIKSVHDNAGKITQPVLRKYPLLFAFLVILSVSAITHGLRDLLNEVEFFNAHPGVLILLGILVLILTGKLYKWLEKGSEE
jgi:hypothetical protein